MYTCVGDEGVRHVGTDIFGEGPPCLAFQPLALSALGREASLFTYPLGIPLETLAEPTKPPVTCQEMHSGPCGLLPTNVKNMAQIIFLKSF